MPISLSKENKHLIYQHIFDIAPSYFSEILTAYKDNDSELIRHLRLLKEYVALRADPSYYQKKLADTKKKLSEDEKNSIEIPLYKPSFNITLIQAAMAHQPWSVYGESNYDLIGHSQLEILKLIIANPGVPVLSESFAADVWTDDSGIVSSYKTAVKKIKPKTSFSDLSAEMQEALIKQQADLVALASGLRDRIYRTESYTLRVRILNKAIRAATMPFIDGLKKMHDLRHIDRDIEIIRLALEVGAKTNNSKVIVMLGAEHILDDVLANQANINPFPFPVHLTYERVDTYKPVQTLLDKWNAYNNIKSSFTLAPATVTSPRYVIMPNKTINFNLTASAAANSFFSYSSFAMVATLIGVIALLAYYIGRYQAKPIIPSNAIHTPAKTAMKFNDPASRTPSHHALTKQA